MSPFGEYVELEDLPADVYSDLVDELNKNSAWKTIATHLVKTRRGSLSMSWIARLERKANAPNATRSVAELLLNSLRARLCDVEGLCEILEACDLLYALYILRGPECLVIEQQPYSNSKENPFLVEIGETFTLTCKARSLPPPKYQWLQGNVEIPDQTSSTLNLLIKSFDQDGEYQCRVRQYNRDRCRVDEKFSVCVPLTIKPTEVEILKQPSCEPVKEGDTLVLSCEAKGHPNPEYQWYKDEEKLRGKNCSTLQVKNFRRKKKGIYYCMVSNKISEKRSNKIEVKVDYPRQTAMYKIALVIGNVIYENEDDLPKAENDALAIAACLEKINFHVICLVNLNLHEMIRAIELFCSLLMQNVYGLFYFAGHGFKIENCYMMPVDTPEEYRRTNVISEEFLLSLWLERNPALLVVILDTCQIIPSEKTNKAIFEEQSKPKKYTPNNNLLRAYSTCHNRSSYELENAENGIYVSHLIKYITKDKPVKEMFEEVRQSLVESTKGEAKHQVPEITDVLTQPYRYLTDETICENKSVAEKMKQLTTFKPQTVTIHESNLSYQVIVQPLCMNVIQLSISGLENWDVSFDCPGDPEVELITNGMGRLKINVGKSGTICYSKDFRYLKYVPASLKAIFQQLNRQPDFLPVSSYEG